MEPSRTGLPLRTDLGNKPSQRINKGAIAVLFLVMLVIIVGSVFFNLQIQTENTILKSQNSALTNELVEREQDLDDFTEECEAQQSKCLRKEDLTDVYYSTTDRCTMEECLFRHSQDDVYPLGVGTVVGYFTQDEDEVWGETALCDKLVVTSGSEPLVNAFREYIKSGNTVQHLDTNGNLLLNMNFSILSEEEVVMIQSSTKENPVILTVFRDDPLDTEVSACYSFVDIFHVKSMNVPADEIKTE
ncbi:MAG TPA: hypothetical protein VJA22_01200 [Patescibacteria group bacterium]|nr:hypothetical protein [Patescibacteria group bacterium]